MKNGRKAFLAVSLIVASVGMTFAESRGKDIIDIPFKASKPEKFSMSFSDAGWYAYKKEWRVFDDIKNATNVELDLLVIPSTDYNNKRSLLISTGDAPYIMPKSYPGTEVPFIPSGQILPVSDYLNLMPNFSACIKKWNLQADIETLRQRDGKFYVLPGLHETYCQDYSIAIRSDIFKANGIPEPNTWDDIEKACRILKKKYPDLYPYSERWMLGCTFNLAGPAFGLGATGLKTPGVNWNNNNSNYYNDKTDKFEFYPTSKQYKDMLTYFARLVKDGLLDPESATQTDDQAVAKFTTGKSFIIACNAQEVNNYRTKMDSALGKGTYEVKRINVPAGPAGGRLVGNRLENGVMIAAKAKDDPNFKDMMKFVDWLWYSYSGQEMTKWGIEGKTYTFSNGIYKLMPGLKLPAYGIAGSDTDKDLRIEYGYGGGNLILSYGGPKQLQYSFMSDENKAFTKLVNETRTINKAAPVILYDEEDLEAQNMIQQPLMDYVFQMTYKFVLGQEDLTKGWDAFVKECKSKGSDRYINTANKVYQAQKKLKK
jgi:putative aldouronate transport system substrate-binding protein